MCKGWVTRWLRGDEWVVYTGEGNPLRLKYVRRVRAAPTVTTIRDHAFARCFKLKEVDLSNVASMAMGEGAFKACESLERIVLPSAATVIGAYCFYECIKLKEVDLSNVVTIGGGAFGYCSSLEHLNIPSAVTVVSANAFHGCTKLEKVDTCEGLQIIEKNALRDCTSLECFIVPSTVTAIGANAFFGCVKLNKVTLCEGILEIEGSAFQNCTSLPCINIPSIAFVIETETFRCRLTRVGVVTPTHDQIIITKRLKSMLPNGRIEMKNTIDEILDRGDSTKEKKLDQIRGLFTYYDLIDDAMTLLELAIWKVNIDETNDQGSDARQSCRRNCGADMNIIMKGVLQFFNYSAM